MQDAAGREGHPHEVERERTMKTPANRADRFAGKLDSPRKRAQIAVVQGRIRRTNRQVGRARKRDPNVSGGERGGIVDAITHEQRMPAVCPREFNCGTFIVREHPGAREREIEQCGAISAIAR
jgi:hypothetical protein